jgi:hypothetical protein
LIEVISKLYRSYIGDVSNKRACGNLTGYAYEEAERSKRQTCQVLVSNNDRTNEPVGNLTGYAYEEAERSKRQTCQVLVRKKLTVCLLWKSSCLKEF